MAQTASIWSTQQLAEFVVAVSSAPEEQAAMAEGVQRAAEALDADVAAIVRDGEVLEALGWPAGERPADRIAAVAAAGAGALPVPGRGEVAAVVADLGESPPAQLVLARGADPHIDAVETGLLRGMARTLGLALRTLRTLEAQRAQQRLLEGLALIQRSIAHRAPLHEVLDAIVALVGELLGDDLQVVFLRDPDDPATLVLEASDGRVDTMLAAVRHRRIGEGAAGRAVSENRLVVIEDYQEHDQAMQVFVDRKLQAAMAAPVHENGEPVGVVLVASWREGRRFSIAERSMLEALARHASMALTDAKTVNAMVHQALHDALTALPNRALFLDRLEHALARAIRAGGEVAVLFLDLDRFKTVNDSLGHVAGDELLCAVAERISDCMRAADTAARLGGDEFAVLLEDLTSTREAVRVAERIIGALAAPVMVGGREVCVGASIGIATGTHGAQDLLRHADVAMYRAKAEGRGRYALFETGMQVEVMERLELEAELRSAVERNELELFYQPIVELADGTLAGHEALLRWSHPRRGLVAPSAFIPVAEETGPDHPDRRLRPARGGPPGRLVACPRRRPRAGDARQSLRPPARGARARRRGPRGPARDRPSCRPARARDHRDRSHAGHRGGDRAAAGTARARRAARPRRLRHRLLVAALPQPLPARHAEDGQAVRGRARGAVGGPGARAGDHRAR